MPSLDLPDLQHAIVHAASRVVSYEHKRLQGPTPDVLWHYTDAEGAKGIIETQELWATDALFMNDPSELQLVKAMFEHMTQDDDVLVPYLTTDTERDAFKAALNEELNGPASDFGIYAVCFCEDGDLLSQWRSYGRRGGGYALGLDGEAVESVSDATFPFSFFKVVYDHKRHFEGAKSILIEGLQPLLDFAPKDDDERMSGVQMAGWLIGNRAAEFGCRIKHAAFEEEQEWRLLHRPNGGAVDRVEFPRCFRATERGLLPFVKINLGDLHEACRPGSGFPLRGVRTGPVADHGLSGRAMNYLLQDHGHDIMAEPSLIPLRD
jgi:hypothetical protein